MVDLIDTIVYAGRLKDKSALMSSSSGGAFTALSDAFLKSGDAVVAAVQGDHHAKPARVAERLEEFRLLLKIVFGHPPFLSLCSFFALGSN